MTTLRAAGSSPAVVASQKRSAPEGAGHKTGSRPVGAESGRQALNAQRRQRFRARLYGRVQQDRWRALWLRRKQMPAKCLVPGFDGAFFSPEWRDALWAKFFTGAPARQRRCVARSTIVKRA